MYIIQNIRKVDILMKGGVKKGYSKKNFDSAFQLQSAILLIKNINTNNLLKPIKTKTFDKEQSFLISDRFCSTFVFY